ncbi:cytochrome c biogenesis protein CcsA [Neiella marina]|uniref:Cytochrome c biogenesis protein CcsA n=1 Tax=Neiella holothuriorum TaxID=2870530 RepID=A0ABS7EKC5_9GAMM|nr:cytochrome c biogenesis protein CcsA [Neiella holothuriorum]MBW8192804.1 cytochrome c biogenesis protein CcsA [Neiella holothuriorum]
MLQPPQLAIAVVVLYVAIALILWQQWVRPGKRQLAPMLLAAPALLLHTGLLSWQLFAVGGLLDFSLPNVASLVLLLVAAILTLAHHSLKSLLLLPPVYLLCAAANIPAMTETAHYFTSITGSTGLAIHISLAVLSYCCMFIAALMAVQVWLIDHRLKQHGPLHGLPPLMVVDRQLSLLLRVGFVLLSTSILSGWYFLESFFGHGQGHKAILTIIAWFIYGHVLWIDWRSGMSSKRMAILSIVSASVLTLAYFGSRLVREVVLG